MSISDVGDEVGDLMSENDNLQAEIERLNKKIALLQNALVDAAVSLGAGGKLELAEFTRSLTTDEEAADWLSSNNAKVRDKLIAIADEERKHIAARYQQRIDDDCSDMTSNSDWMRLEGAVAIILAMKGKP